MHAARFFFYVEHSVEFVFVLTVISSLPILFLISSFGKNEFFIYFLIIKKLFEGFVLYFFFLSDPRI